MAWWHSRRHGLREPKPEKVVAPSPIPAADGVEVVEFRDGQVYLLIPGSDPVGPLKIREAEDVLDLRENYG